MLTNYNLRLIEIYKLDHLKDVLTNDQVQDVVNWIIESRHQEIVKKHLKILQS